MIYGVGSSYNNIFNPMNSVNQMRMHSVIAKNPEYESLFNTINSWNKNASGMFGLQNSEKKTSSLDFLQDYNKKMTGVMQSANTLRSNASSGVLKQLKPDSSDESVAEVSKKFNLRQSSSYKLTVSQIAVQQENRSNAVSGKDQAKESMNFTISNDKGEFSFSVEAADKKGLVKTNRMMFEETAASINKADAGVTAEVKEDEDGNILLSIQSSETGTDSEFEISGQLGAAEGVQNITQNAADAEYTIVSKSGIKSEHTSQSNNIEIAFGTFQATLKGTGTTYLSAQPDTEEIITAAADLINSYNKASAFLEENTYHGRGVSSQAENFSSPVSSASTLSRLGISTGKKDELVLDKDILKKSLEDNPEFTRQLLAGTAENIFDRSAKALKTNSASLISNDLQEISGGSFITEPFSYMSMYSGMYPGKNSREMQKYVALGLMMDIFA